MWKLLPRNDNYMVSDDGNIYSIRLKKILTPKRNWDGYSRIQIWTKGKCEFVSLHRLIAEAFLPVPPDECYVINHKNGIKNDNRVENLEWVTQQQNIRHAWENGLSKSHPTNNKIIRQLTLDGNEICVFSSITEAMQITGIHRSNIAYALSHKGVSRGYRWEVVQVENPS